jgi:tetratricopeptide (TPR) repeat protein
LAAAALGGLTFAAFVPALRCGFVNFDDPQYVTKNRRVKDGLSAGGAAWAFITFENANWHPLTWLSLQLDATLWKGPGGKLDPRGFHLTNVLLHAANAALLFLALRALTGAHWRSLAVALLFAVHPLRVESVAWVSERKDVLCALFGLLALWAYAGYATAPSLRRYLAVAVPFALSLMAKPMLVTLPCLLLVLDWWPLARARAAKEVGSLFETWRPLVAEKLPLFALVAASCVVTARAQAEGRAVMSLEVFRPAVREGNALLGYAAYLCMTVWPNDLAIYYPHPGEELPLDRTAAAALLLAALTAGAVALRRRAPYLLAGWLWYVGTLVPVIGLVQVGGQAYADRYTYVPQVGLLIAVCWGAAGLARARPRWVRAAVGGAGVAAAAVLAVLTWKQLQFWHDSLTLWERDLAVARPCLTSVINLGEALEEHGRLAEATERFREAVGLAPNDLQACYDLGNALLKQGMVEEAAAHLKWACRIDPKSASAHVRLGDALARLRRPEEAVRQYEEGLLLAPDMSSAHCNLGQVQATLGRLDDAARSFRKAIALRPDFAEAHYNLGTALEIRGDLEGAARCFAEAAAVSPAVARPWYNLGRVRSRQGRHAEAVECFEQALRRDPGSPELKASLETARKALEQAGRGANGRPGIPGTDARAGR